MQGITIIINKSFRDGMTPEELYEATRRSWKINGEQRQAEYALAVAHGEVREVYRVQEWHPADDKRWEFGGRLADKNIRERCIGKPYRNRHGDMNPIHLVPDLEEFMARGGGFAIIVKREHVESAIAHILHNGKKGAHDIWYLFRQANAWAVLHESKRIAARETMRIAYYFAKGQTPSGEDGMFTREQLIHGDTSEARNRLQQLGFDVRRFGESESEDGMTTESENLRLLRQFYQIIFHGPPGTGKTYTAKNIVRELLGAEMTQGERWDIVQFHPSYNYEDFVRGVKVKTESGEVVYETVNRVFGDMCERAAADSENPYALIIDEINRANVSAVLGELIYALEYRGEAVKTPYLGDIVIPKNLFVIGTMNTADRTIGQIDYAVRRRFAFVHCPPKAEVITNETAREFFNRVDGVFDEHISPDFDAADVRVGHSYFLADGNAELSAKIVYQVVPILREYVKDGVLTKDAESVIDEIEKDVKKLSADESGDSDSSANDDDESRKGKQYFYWRNGDRSGVGGVGRAGLGAITDFIRQHPDMDADALEHEFAPLDSGQRKRVSVSARLPKMDGIKRYFLDDHISLTNGEYVMVSADWGARGGNERQWELFKSHMAARGYSVGQCHLVNIGENDGDEPRARSWDDCHKYCFVSGRGKGYKIAVESLKKGDFVFVRIAGPQEGRSGFIAYGEVAEEAVHISEFRTAEGELLADCDVGDGQTYRKKYPNAFDAEYPDYAARVKWLPEIKSRNETVQINAPPRKFRADKINRSDFAKLRAAFNLPGYDI
ncbi:MAG: AAA family ATPase [Gammaproteobacteria bacterium]